jgi:NTE family protein
MAKSTISESMPTIVLHDQVVPDAPLAERPFIPKPRVASKGKGRNLRAGLPFDHVALLLQGGGALGAYQAGVYEALAETGLHPDWVLGISIGAINAAIIAGNAPERRVDKLRGFWEEISAPAMGFHADVVCLFERGEAARVCQSGERRHGCVRRGAGLLQTAHSQSVVSSARHHRGDELL